MATGPVILDTDTLSEFSRGSLPVHRRTLAYLTAFGRLTTTSITVFERLRGYELAMREGKTYGTQLKAFELLVSTCVVLPFDRDAAAIASRIWSAAGRSRRRELGDILIAGIAVSRRLPLVTRNRKDFEPLVGAAGLELELLDWSR